MAIISARNLGNPSTVNNNNHRHAKLALSFYMVDVLAEEKKHQYPPSTAKLDDQLPFSKPLLGLFPPIGGIPLTVPANSVPVTGLPYETLDLQGATVSLPAMAALRREELELGTVTTVNEDIYQGPVYGSSCLGKAEGIYVDSSEEGNCSHMMAIMLSLIRDDDGLRLFGVHRTDVKESHVAVIGGTGKYHNANGYATIEIVNGSYSGSSVAKSNSNRDEGYKLLHFKVYLG